jgi:hypothetical protein
VSALSVVLVLLLTAVSVAAVRYVYRREVLRAPNRWLLGGLVCGYLSLYGFAILALDP